MNRNFARNHSARKNLTVFAALTVAAIAATPLVMSASRALATPEEPGAVTQTVAIVPVEVGTLRSTSGAESCQHKVRIVYSGYGTSADGCAAH